MTLGLLGRCVGPVDRHQLLGIGSHDERVGKARLAVPDDVVALDRGTQRGAVGCRDGIGIHDPCEERRS